jgi:hypothetical protein
MNPFKATQTDRLRYREAGMRSRDIVFEFEQLVTKFLLVARQQRNHFSFYNA